VRSIDAFDYSSSMIDRAKRSNADPRIHFFHDDLLEPTNIGSNYDVVICVRVLINLPDLVTQRRAIANLISFVKAGGRLILIEGFLDGFENLNAARKQLGMPPLQPAAINFYSKIAEVWDMLEPLFETRATFHTGSYDYYTRVVYPMLVGPENVRANSELSEKFMRLAKVFNPDSHARFARLRGFVLERK
jgi:SAM-dependent methyltransferase